MPVTARMPITCRFSEESFRFSIRSRARRWAAPLLGLCAALALSGCLDKDRAAKLPKTPEKDQVVLEETSFSRLPGWNDDSLSEALPALRRSCARFARWPDDKTLGPDGLAGTAAQWKDICTSLEQLQDGIGDAALRQWLEANFVPYQVRNNDRAEGLFTGYYEAELKGAFTPDETYRYPLYRVPDDLVSVKLGKFDPELKGKRLIGRVESGELLPYHQREAIDEGALADKGLELLWSDDPVDVFFLHIQGSGQVVLPDGQTVRVGYAGNNGHAFYAIGRALIEEGYVSRDKASMQSIRQWLRDNPDEAEALMQRNARYIFFRKIDGEGPIGAFGVPLTPARSLAVDPSFMPLGAPLWLDTTWPGAKDKPLRRLMVAQDSGSAIKGPVRGDFFWGPGEKALAFAGGMKQKGRYYLLLPKEVAERRRASN